MRKHGTMSVAKGRAQAVTLPMNVTWQTQNGVRTVGRRISSDAGIFFVLTAFYTLLKWNQVRYS